MLHKEKREERREQPSPNANITMHRCNQTHICCEAWEIQNPGMKYVTPMQDLWGGAATTVIRNLHFGFFVFAKLFVLSDKCFHRLAFPLGAIMEWNMAREAHHRSGWRWRACFSRANGRRNLLKRRGSTQSISNANILSYRFVIMRGNGSQNRNAGEILVFGFPQLGVSAFLGVREIRSHLSICLLRIMFMWRSSVLAPYIFPSFMWPYGTGDACIITWHVGCPRFSRLMNRGSGRRGISRMHCERLECIYIQSGISGFVIH